MSKPHIPDVDRAIDRDPIGTYRRHTRWGDGLAAADIPRHMHVGLVRYILLGVRPGQFLNAVVSSDLFSACRMADDVNVHALPAYARFFHNYAPMGCFGSAGRVRAWIEAGGFIGAMATQEAAE